jgi:dynein heavy chain 2
VTEGFTQSKDLASKIVSLFKLSKQLLSSQQHYDWGLRALKAVLNSGGRLIQMYKTQGTEVVDAKLEYEILIKAVRVNTLSKLTFGDTYKFLALIGDVFPGVPSSDITGYVCSFLLFVWFIFLYLCLIGCSLRFTLAEDRLFNTPRLLFLSK